MKALPLSCCYLLSLQSCEEAPESPSHFLVSKVSLFFPLAIKAASLSWVLVLSPPNSSKTPHTWCLLIRWGQRDSAVCFHLPCRLPQCIRAISSLQVTLQSSLACSLYSHRWPSSHSSQHHSPIRIGEPLFLLLCYRSHHVVHPIALEWILLHQPSHSVCTNH